MKYSKAICDKICELKATGNHTLEQICDKVKIATSTYHKWKKEQIEFSNALVVAEEMRLDSITQMARTGLAKLVAPEESEEIFEEWEFDEDGKDRLVKKRIVKKTANPNATAVIFTLTNGDSDNFKHTNHLDMTSKGKSIVDYSNTSTDDLKERAALLDKLESSEDKK